MKSDMALRYVVVLVLGVLFPVYAAPAASAQSAGASIHVGTLGLGGRATMRLTDQINIRGGVDFVPVSIQIAEADIEVEMAFPTPAATVVFDLHPGGGGFRLSAGALFFGRIPGFEGRPKDEVEFGDGEYAAAQVGTLRGSLGTRRFAPYVGLGWGNALGAGYSFTFDLGVALHGTPDFSFEATGPVSSDPQFRADLRAEAEEVNDDLPGVAAIYPILHLGISRSFNWGM